MKQRMAARKLVPEAYEAVAELHKRVSEFGIDLALYLLIKIRASQINGCAFCIDLHIREARKWGEAEERIYALNAWRESPLFTDEERAALDREPRPRSAGRGFGNPNPYLPVVGLCYGKRSHHTATFSVAG